MESFVLCFLSILCYLGAQGQVISEPDDVTVCEDEHETILTCVLNITNSSISSGDIRWYRFIKDTSTTVQIKQKDDIISVPISSDTTLTATLRIREIKLSYTGYYWLRLFSSGDDLCNTSFTVTTKPSALSVSIMKNTESSSVVVQWDEVDDSLTTNYTVTWTSNGTNPIQSHTLTEQSSYTITGLILGANYTINVTAANKCGTGPVSSTSVLFSADTKSNTSSNDSVSLMSTVDPTTTIVTSFSMGTTTAVTMSSTSIITTDSTTSSITNLDATTETTSAVTSSTVNAITFVITSSSTIITTTAATTTTTAAATTTTTAATTTTTAAATTTTTAAANNNTATIVVATSATSISIVMPPTSSAQPSDTTANDDSSGDDNIAYLIVGATLGGIIILSLLIVMFCCFGRNKSDIFNRIKFGSLKDKSTTDKNILMAANPLSANDDDDKKPAKLEAETSHQTSATLEGPVMMPDMESIVDSSINSRPLEPSDAYDKLGPPRPLDQFDSDDKLPSLIKDDDTCDKGDGGLHNDGSPCSDVNRKNDVPVDDPQKGTYDVPVVTVPCVDGPTSDGANQNKTDGRLNYAVLDTLPAPTGNYIRKDNSDVTAYAIVT